MIMKLKKIYALLLSTAIAATSCARAVNPRDTADYSQWGSLKTYPLGDSLWVPGEVGKIEWEQAYKCMEDIACIVMRAVRNGESGLMRNNVEICKHLVDNVVDGVMWNPKDGFCGGKHDEWWRKIVVIHKEREFLDLLRILALTYREYLLKKVDVSTDAVKAGFAGYDYDTVAQRLSKCICCMFNCYDHTVNAACYALNCHLNEFFAEHAVGNRLSTPDVPWDTVNFDDFLKKISGYTVNSVSNSLGELPLSSKPTETSPRSEITTNLSPHICSSSTDATDDDYDADDADDDDDSRFPCAKSHVAKVKLADTASPDVIDFFNHELNNPFHQFFLNPTTARKARAVAHAICDVRKQIASGLVSRVPRVTEVFNSALKSYDADIANELACRDSWEEFGYYQPDYDNAEGDGTLYQTSMSQLLTDCHNLLPSTGGSVTDANQEIISQSSFRCAKYILAYIADKDNKILKFTPKADSHTMELILLSEISSILDPRASHQSKAKLEYAYFSLYRDYLLCIRAALLPDNEGKIRNNADLKAYLQEHLPKLDVRANPVVEPSRTVTPDYEQKYFDLAFHHALILREILLAGSPAEREERLKKSNCSYAAEKDTIFKQVMKTVSGPFGFKRTPSGNKILKSPMMSKSGQYSLAKDDEDWSSDSSSSSSSFSGSSTPVASTTANSTPVMQISQQSFTSMLPGTSSRQQTSSERRHTIQPANTVASSTSTNLSESIMPTAFPPQTPTIIPTQSQPQCAGLNTFASPNSSSMLTVPNSFTLPNVMTALNQPYVATDNSDTLLRMRQSEPLVKSLINNIKINPYSIFNMYVNRMIMFNQCTVGMSINNVTTARATLQDVINNYLNLRTQINYLHFTPAQVATDSSMLNQLWCISKFLYAFFAGDGLIFPSTPTPNEIQLYQVVFEGLFN